MVHSDVSYIHVSLPTFDYSVYRTLLVSAIDTAQSPLKDDMLIPEISERRALAKEPELPEKTKDDFFDLIDKLDKYNEFKEKQERPERSAGTRWHWLVALNVVYLLLCFLYANSLYNLTKRSVTHCILVMTCIWCTCITHLSLADLGL